MKIDGITLLQMSKNKELKPKTLIRTEHKREYFDDNRSYDYYIYFGENQFHRCDENGNLGAKYQNKFLNYDTLNKNFEIYKILEEKPKKIEEIEIYKDTSSNYYIVDSETRSHLYFGTDECEQKIIEQQNEIIKAVNYLLKKEDE